MNVFHLPGAIVGDPRCNCVMCERNRLEKRSFRPLLQWFRCADCGHVVETNSVGNRQCRTCFVGVMEQVSEDVARPIFDRQERIAHDRRIGYPAGY